MPSLTNQDRELLACTSYIEILALELNYRCLKNTQYSLRAFARDLGIAASNLSTLIRGRSKLLAGSVYKIADKLQKPEPVREYFVQLALAQIEAPEDPYNEHLLKARELRLRFLYAPIQASHRTIEQWDLTTFALVLMLRISGELHTDDALCLRLGIPLEKLLSIVNDLKQLGWLEESDDGPTSRIRFMEMGDQGNAYHIRAIHRRTLRQAMESLDNLPVESRYFYTSYFTMDPCRFAEIGEKMRTFALSTAEDAGPPSSGQEVYALGTYLIPLTQPLTPK